MTSKRTNRQNAIEHQINRLEIRIANMKSLSRRLSWYRLLIFIIGGALIFLTALWINKTLSWIVFSVFFVVFNIVAHYHRRLERGIRRHQLWLEIKKNQLARMNLDWDNIPLAELKLPVSDLPYENDLDITGNRSLHQLIDTSVSAEGSQQLAAWLLQKLPGKKNIIKRQKIVRELVPLTRFRNKLLLNFKLVSTAQLEGRKLLDWLRQETPSGIIERLLPISAGFVALNIGLFVWHQFGNIPPYWMLSLFLYIIFYLYSSKSLSQYFELIFHIDDELAKFRRVLKYAETYPYGHHRHLKTLVEPFLNQQKRPSRQLRKIKLVTAAIGLRMNPMTAVLLNVLVPWDFYFAAQIRRHQQQLTTLLPQWLDTWSKLEALNSLANFAYLNPDDTFPEIIDSNDTDKTPILRTIALGHPLIPADQKVCNDFSVANLGNIFVVTGSNMSGKSTFLKTIGVNLCLAYAGGVVDANSFHTSLFRIFTSIKINDSIVDGFSFFYAEVRRLRELLDALQVEDSLPIFFLIDEIFKGTNNRERLIGSRSYIQSLIGQNGTGLVATHDLELVKLADQFPAITNLHFREEVQDGKMVFDYKLHPGPCPTTNALKIMKLEGLPVEIVD